MAEARSVILKNSFTHLGRINQCDWPRMTRTTGRDCGVVCNLMNTHTRRKNKMLLLDITTVVNPCASSNLENAARYAGKHLADAVERKKNMYRGSFLSAYSLLPLAMSNCGEVGSDVHTLIKELAIRRVEHRSETPSNESLHLAEGTEVARLRRRFSSVLQQVLSFRTRYHLCRQGWGLRAPDSSVRKAL